MLAIPFQKAKLLAIIDAAEVGALKTALMRSLAERKLQQVRMSHGSPEARDAFLGPEFIDAEAALFKSPSGLT